MHAQKEMYLEIFVPLQYFQEGRKAMLDWYAPGTTQPVGHTILSDRGLGTFSRKWGHENKGGCGRREADQGLVSVEARVGTQDSPSQV